MKQPIKGDKLKNVSISDSNQKKPILAKKKHPKYGTSKLEEDFAKNFLDKLGVEYIYQFEAKDIGRFYDFYIKSHNVIIEIDGDFWHGNPDLFKQDELKNHQIRAQRIDELKNKWALLHGIPLIRIWERDIRKNPSDVMRMLKEEFNKQDKKLLIKENKKKRH